MNKKKLVTTVFVFSSIIFFVFLTKNNCKMTSFAELKNADKISKQDALRALKEEYKINEIIALVFYGRTDSVSILIRYLDINLRKNGGVLDKVIFAVHTNVVEDLNFIQNFTEKNNEFYKKVNHPVGKSHIKSYFKHLYHSCKNNDIVFKIDDDIVFIQNGTFELMLKEYLENKHFVLSANVINHAHLSYVHARQKAILPFYETKKYVWEKAQNITELDDTLVFDSTYSTYSTWWSNGRQAAIALESFLYHAYNNNLNVYRFRVWDFNSVGYTERVRINFIIIWGQYVNKLNQSKSFTDETYITIDMPKLLKKHTLSLGSALVVHFAYYNQIRYLKNTGILKKFNDFSFYYLNNSNTVKPVDLINI